MAKPVAERGPLCGLPIPIKDLADVAGVRSTQGSPIFADHIAGESDILVEHLEAQGGIVYAMSNTPEFGAGANTFNEVFGRTLNPWNLSRSAAGSSGGAAVALATGMAWVAHGSDWADRCAIRRASAASSACGHRPGASPPASRGKIDGTLSVEGPMARNVEDLALLSRCDGRRGARRSPVAAARWHIAISPRRARAGSRSASRSAAISASRRSIPRSPRIVDCGRARASTKRASSSRRRIPISPKRMKCFQVLARPLLRGLGASRCSRSIATSSSPKSIWNIEKRPRARRRRDRARRSAARRHVQAHARHSSKPTICCSCPATIVAAFPGRAALCRPHATAIDSTTTIDWLAIAYAITNVACPAISIPAGFTREDLPVGIQIVAPCRGEARLLAGAKLLEDCLALPRRTPIDPRPETETMPLPQ